MSNGTTSNLPSVDYVFITQLLSTSSKVQASVTVGKTTAYILKGKSVLNKRTIYVAKLKGNTVDFNCATNVAIRIGCLQELLEWLKENRNWKDGGHFIPHRA